MQNLLSFDIEIANVFTLAPGEDLERYAPFDISVAAAATHGGSVRHWHARDVAGRPSGVLDAKLAREVLEYLRAEQQQGTRVCAWNGLSFDLRWLGHVARDMQLASEVALELYDPMFQFATQRGFPIGLAAAAEGMGIAQKKLMSADRAPVEWQAGNHQVVLDYVAGDCTLTNQVAAAIEHAGQVKWRTKRGTLSSEPMVKLRQVRDVMRDPPPDQGWMSEPKPVSNYWAWMKNAIGAGA
ncbi:MAG: hypothetical protein IPJ19_11000 [Planctomycetes bacterium]|nr:hypothetical protein [Planctomycetota bacterium]